MMSVSIKRELPKVIEDSDYFAQMLPKAIEAGAFIVEREYVRQTPADDGKYMQSIAVSQSFKKDEFIVSPNAKSGGFNYPLALYTGTGRMRGKPDFGYTSGRVRAGDVARGIGGIRPNKVAKRVAEDSKTQKKAYTAANNIIKEIIKKH